METLQKLIQLVQKQNIDWSLLLAALLKPLFIIAVWYAVDQILKKLHAKTNVVSGVIERFITRSSNELKRHVLEQRTKTFRELALQTLRILNGIFFIFVLLDSIDIDPKPLLAGVGVVGLGLSLAAQNILRDFINGIFIVVEDQYNIGDWVQINAHSGTVESFTMRVTRLRDTTGRLITIPNGTIQQVVNSTKNYAVAYVEVGVSYDSDVSKVIGVLEECGRELKQVTPGVLLDIPKAQGILDFRDSDLLMRVMVKTLPGEQWAVERMLRRLIKERFDKAGIEIPYPQVVSHNLGDPFSPADAGEKPSTE